MLERGSAQAGTGQPAAIDLVPERDLEAHAERSSGIGAYKTRVKRDPRVAGRYEDVFLGRERERVEDATDR